MQNGLLEVEIIPCDAEGREFSENDDIFVDNPQQLRGRNVYYNFKILGCRGLPNKYAVNLVNSIYSSEDN
jgi:kinesin family member 1